MPSPGGTIYAIGAMGTSWVKIGCTTGPVMKRLQTLQTGQPFPLQVRAAIPVETDAHRIERQVHAFLEAERRRGEWFDVPMDTATLEALIVRAVAYLAAQEAPQDRGEMEQTIREIVGERVLLLRRRLKLSQPELAQQAGMSVTTLNRVENAHQSLYMEKIVALATALGTTADYLLGLSDNPSTPRALVSTPQNEHAGERVHQEADAALPPQPKRQRMRKAPAVA